MKSVAICSMKGGVGKTSAAVNLAYAAARDGYGTLLCDLDAQGSASYCFRVKPNGVKASRLVRGGRKVASSIKGTDFTNLDILPASLSFRHLAVALSDAEGFRKRLGKVLGRLGSGYDLLVLDVHSGLDLEAESLMRTADLLLIPVVPSSLSVNTFHTVRAFMRKRDMNLNRLRVFFSMVDARRRLHRETVEQLGTDPAVLPVSVPYSSLVERMAAEREPLLVRHGRSAPGRAYTELWDSVRAELGLVPGEETHAG